MSLRLASLVSAALFSACLLELIATADVPVASAEAASAYDGLAHVPSALADGVRACGDGNVCMAPQPDARDACTLALPLLMQDGRLSAEARCGEPLEHAASDHPAVRNVVLFRVHEQDNTAHFALLVASDAGFDRYVALYDAPFMAITTVRFAFPEFELVEPSTGGAPVLRVQVDAHAETGTQRADLTWVSDASELALCRFDGEQGASCLSPIPLRTRLTESAQGLAKARVLNDYELAVRLVGDGVDIQRRRGNVPRELRTLYGRHSLPALRARLIDLASHH